MQTKVHFNFFYSVRIETTHKPSKVPAAKFFFSNVYVIDATYFDECFFVSCDNWKGDFNFYKG